MRHATLAAALALIAALLVACSSDGESTPQPQTEQAEQAEQGRTQPDAAERSQQTQSSQQAARSSTEQSEQDRTEPNAAEQAEQTQPAQQGEQDRTVSNTAQQSEQPQSTEQAEQDRTEPNGAEQTEQEQQAQTQSQQSQPEQQQAAPDEQQDQQSEQSRTESNAAEQEQAQQQAQTQPEPSETERLRLRAEEIRANATVPDVVGLNGWLNGEETSIALEIAKGNVVLIDFWTYTCINCVRTLPFLTAWDEKYRDHGLVIIGVHTPEFEFEERVENIRAAIAEHNIEYLVAIDNDYRTWRAFQNRWWPRKFLIGPTADGSPMGIRYDHIGEGDYPETEIAIRQALEAVGKDLSDIPIGVDVEIPTRQGGTPRQTRELYAGWSRNNGSGGPYAGQEAYFLAGPGVPTFYSDIPTSERRHNLWYLQGLWETDRESIGHARETGNLEDYIAFVVRGRTANVVLTVAEDGQPFNVYVELDGRWLHPGEAGAHIQWDDEGRSYIRVTENDLYRLIFLPEWSEHELKLRSDSDQFRIFAFTFGSYVGGE